MQKRRLLVLVIGLMLSLNSFAQSDPDTKSDSKGSFFFSIGFYNGIFSNGPVIPFSNFEIKMLRAGTIGGYYELTSGPGKAFFGLEAGYSSGSKFGGKGGVDFIPIDLTAAYVFPLTSFFYIGPRLKLGALGMLGPEWNRAVLTAGARLDAELRFTGFPIGLYVAGGIDLFPTAPELAILPVIEAGLRYPRGKFTWFGSSDTKGKESAKTDTGSSRDDLSGNTAAAPASVALVPATPTPTPATPAAPAPVTPVAAAPAPATGAQTALTPTISAPAATTPASAAPTATAPVTGAASGTGTQGQNRTIILEDGRQGILNSIYFEPDTAVLIETYRPILDIVGRQLAADQNLKLLIRAYTADFGTADGRYIVSVSRARFARDFFTAQYGVSLNRFNLEAYGSDRSPIYATSDWQSHRCVELILLRD